MDEDLYNEYRKLMERGFSHEDAWKKANQPKTDETTYSLYKQLREGGAAHEDAYRRADEIVKEERAFTSKMPTLSRVRSAATRGLVQALADYGPGLLGRGMQALEGVREIARPPMREGEEPKENWRQRLAQTLVEVPEKTERFLGQFAPLEPGAPEIAGTVLGRGAVDIGAALGAGGAARAAPLVGPALRSLAGRGAAGRAASTTLASLPFDVAQGTVYDEGIVLPGQKGAIAENILLSGAAGAIEGVAESAVRTRREAARKAQEAARREQEIARSVEERSRRQLTAGETVPLERRLPPTSSARPTRETRLYEEPFIGPEPEPFVGPFGRRELGLQQPLITPAPGRATVAEAAAIEPVEELRSARQLPMAGERRVLPSVAERGPRAGEIEQVRLSPEDPEPVRNVRKSPAVWEEPGNESYRDVFTLPARSGDGSVEVGVIYRLMEADDIVPSNNPFTFAPNPEYPAGVQGRRRQYETKPTQDIVVQQAANLKPSLVLDHTSSMLDGPPLVSPNGIVLAGNNRAMSIQRSIAEFPERYNEYKQQLTRMLKQPYFMGLDESSIRQMERPILVREVQPTEGPLTVGRMAEINAASDIPGTKTKRAVDVAAGKASALRGNERVMGFLSDNMDPEETITAFMNRPEGRQFVDLLIENDIINRSELPSLLTDTGRLSEDGKAVMRRMVMASAFDNFDDFTPDVLRKLETISPQIAAIRGSAGDISDVMNRAALALREASDNKLSLEELASQASMFDEGAMPEVVVDMARYIRDNNQRKITQDMREYASSVMSSRRAAAEGPGLFGEEVAESLTETPEQAARRLGIGGLYTFPGPIVDALKTEVGQKVAGAALGGAVGAQSEEAPLSGALLGAAIGSRVPGAARAIGRGGRAALEATRRFGAAGEVARAAKVNVSNLVSGAPVARGKRSAKKPSTTFGSIYSQIFDQSQPLLDFVGLTRGAKASDVLNERLSQLDGSVKSAVQKISDEYGGWFLENRDNLDAIGNAAVIRADYANRLAIAQGAELPEKGFKLTGYSNERLKNAVAEIEANPYLMRATDELQGMFRDMLSRRVAAGNLDPETFKKIEQSVSYYAPLYRDLSEIVGVPGQEGFKGVRLKPGKGVRGMDRELSRKGLIQDPIEVLIAERIALEKDIIRQSIMEDFATSVENYGNIEGVARVLPKGVKPSQGAKTITINRAGKNPLTVEISDPALFSAIERSREFAWDIFRTIADIKRGAIVLPVDFSAMSLIRDVPLYNVQRPAREVLRETVPGAVVGAGAGALVSEDDNRLAGAVAGAGLGAGFGGNIRSAYEVAEGVAHALGRTELYKEFLRSGASSAGVAVTDPKDIQKIIRSMTQADRKSILHFKNPLDALAFIAEAAENGPRIAQFKKTRSAKEAQFITLPFARIGANKFLQQVISATPFANATLKGWEKLADLIVNKQNRWNTAKIGFATITAPTIGLWMINKDDPEYWKRPLWERNMFWLVPGWAVGRDDVKFFPIPKSHELGLLFASLPERIFDAAARAGVVESAAPEGMDPADEVAVSVTEFLKNGITGTVPIPAAIQAPFEALTNYDIFRGRQITPDYIAQRDPELQYRESTSALGRLLGRYQDVVTPIEFDQAIGSTFGTMGRRGLEFTDVLAEALGAKPPSETRGPVENVLDVIGAGAGVFASPQRFVAGEYNVSQPEYDAYEIVRDAERAASGVRQLRREQESREVVNSYIDRNRDNLRLYERTQSQRAAFDRLREERNRVISSRTISPERKKEILEELSDRGVRIAESVFKAQASIK